MPQHLGPLEWRDEQQQTRYPFAESATLSGQGGVRIPEGMFIDAAIHAIGLTGVAHLTGIAIQRSEVTLYVGDAATRDLCSVSFNPVTPPETLALEDRLGRPAGVLVADVGLLSSLQSWTPGSYRFEPQATAFAASCVHPMPEQGLRGFLLPNGTLVTGDVWLVGGSGVILRVDEEGTDPVIRVDVVGDPLARRRLCEDAELFTTPRLIRALRIVKGDTEIVVTPDARGDVQLVVGDHLVDDPVLRLRTTGDGLILETVGQS